MPYSWKQHHFSQLGLIVFNYQIIFFFFSFSFAAGNFGIVEPFPENIYAIEFSAAQVTCIAFDSSGEMTPEKIKFFRGDYLNGYEEIKANKSLYFTNLTENHGR